MTSMADVHRYAPVCMEEVTAVLGRYPMKKQDILVVPTSFDSLGMARYSTWLRSHPNYTFTNYKSLIFRNSLFL